LAESLTRARAELDVAISGHTTPVERGLIDALRARFPTLDPADSAALGAGHAAYADAMVALLAGHRDDVDVQALTADALLNVSAWALWDTRTGEPAPGSRVLEAKHVLDEALATPAGQLFARLEWRATRGLTAVATTTDTLAQRPDPTPFIRLA
jgi:hypothetical protein